MTNVANSGRTGNKSFTAKSGVSDGASAVAHVLDTTNFLSNPSAKLLSIRNQGVEQLYIGPGGSAILADGAGLNGTYTTGNVAPAFAILDDNCILGPYLDEAGTETGITTIICYGKAYTSDASSIYINGATDVMTIPLDLKLNTVGKGLYVKEGTDATMGVATLAAGTVTVSTTKVTANSRIFLSIQSLGTVTLPSRICVSARTAGTSFTILSHVNTDTSVIAWHIVEPA